MRFPALVLCCALSAPVSAQSVDREGCLRSVEIVMQAVTARAEGKSRMQTRRMLRAALDRNAGDQLNDFVWSLPEDQLTDAVGEAWRAQCEAS